MKHFLKRLMGFSMGPVFGAVISLIQIPILTMLLSEAEYGISTLFSTLIVNIPNFLYIGLDQSYTREYNQAKDKRNLMQQAALLPMIVGILMFIVAIIFSQPISNWLFASPDYSYIVWLSGIWVLATVLERFLLLTIRMEEKALEYSKYTLLLKINVFLVSVGLILIGMRDFRVVVFGLIFGQLIGDAFLFWRYRVFFDIKTFTLEPKLIKTMILFGIPLMLSASLNSVLNSVDTTMLRNYSTLSELGIYGGAMKIVNIIGILKTAFASFWVPTAYRWYEEKKEMKHFKFISDALLFILTALFFGLLLFRPFVMLFIGYDGSKYLLGLLSFPHIMYALSETTTLGIVFSRKTYLNIFVSVAALIPSVLINYLLTPDLGARGAAFASCGAYIIFYLARTYFSNRTGFGFSQRKQILTVCLMTVVAGLNAFDMSYRTLITLAIGLMCLVIQWSTVKDAIEIKQNPDNWDFS